jgi:hypothetical protein
MGAGISSTEPVMQCYKEGNPLGELMGTLVNWGHFSIYIFKTMIKYQKIESLNSSKSKGMNPLRTGLITAQHQFK